MFGRFASNSNWLLCLLLHDIDEEIKCCNWVVSDARKERERSNKKKQCLKGLSHVLEYHYVKKAIFNWMRERKHTGKWIGSSAWEILRYCRFCAKLRLIHTQRNRLRFQSRSLARTGSEQQTEKICNMCSTHINILYLIWAINLPYTKYVFNSIFVVPQ